MSSPDVPSYRQRVGYHSALLGGIALLASTALVMGNLGTAEDIVKRKQEDLEASLQQVIPIGLYDNNILNDKISITDENKDLGTEPISIYRARKDNQVTAVAYQITAFGYAGAIEIILGVQQSGELLGVRVLAHKETPGLGDKIEVEKSDWITGFNGLSIQNTQTQGWNVKKDGGQFDQFTGATITPRAIVKTVHRGVQFFEQHKEIILKTENVAESKHSAGDPQ